MNTILSRKADRRLLSRTFARRSGQGRIVLMRPASSGGGGDADPLVSSLAVDGEPELTGDVVLSEGTGITLTQVGNDIEISVT